MNEKQIDLDEINIDIEKPIEFEKTVESHLPPGMFDPRFITICVFTQFFAN